MNQIRRPVTSWETCLSAQSL